jgi:tol-pal system protein YbgF
MKALYSTFFYMLRSSSGSVFRTLHATRYMLPALASLVLLGGCMTKQGLVWPWVPGQQAIERKIDSLATQMDGRFSEMDSSERARHALTRAELGNEIGTTVDRIEVLSAKLDDLGARFNRAATAVTPRVRPESAAATGDNSANIYRQAYTDYTRGRYDLATPGFRNYIKLFPSSDLADNAQYWLGECYYDQAKYDSAKTEFQKVLDKSTDSDKAPAALFKQGKCDENLHEKEKAIAEFRAVVQKYPRAPEAKLAEEILKQLQR